MGCSFILPASIMYDFKKTKKNAVISCMIGTVMITLFGTTFNALYLLPAFSVLYGMPLDDIIAMGTAVNNGVKDIFTFVLITVAPLNLIKGGVVSVITLLIYKKLSPILKEGRKKRIS